MHLLLLLVILAFLVLSILTRWGRVWGSTAEEQDMALPGDRLLEEAPHPRIRMTRAISINASQELVWRWMAQMGRGGGWYSYDWIDNAGKASARHLVSWIPSPEVGDACAIGRLELLETNRSLTWWAKRVRIPGGIFRCVFDIHCLPRDSNTRLLVRISADATGPLARPFLFAFSFGDSIMARKQLLVVKALVKRYQDRTSNSERPETGKKDQYQWMTCIYTDGATAGRSGRSLAEKWRDTA